MNKKIKIIEESLGWYGAFAILIAYALISFKIISFDDFIYQFLNFTGASGILFISLKKKAYQPAFLNFVWAIIGLIAIILLFIP